MVVPTNETTTGCDERLPESGGLIIMVITDPRLVPTQREGVRTFGSEKKNIQINLSIFCFIYFVLNF